VSWSGGAQAKLVAAQTICLNRMRPSSARAFGGRKDASARCSDDEALTPLLTQEDNEVPIAFAIIPDPS
jgi:hypothetical protein